MKDDTQVQAQQVGFEVAEGMGKAAFAGLSFDLEIPLIAAFQQGQGNLDGKEIGHKGRDARIEAQTYGIEVGVGAHFPAVGIFIVFSIAEAPGEAGLSKQGKHLAVLIQHLQRKKPIAQVYMYRVKLRLHNHLFYNKAKYHNL